MTHEDWLAAKQRRDNAAYLMARAYIAGHQHSLAVEAEKFSEADQEMRRIEKDLDGRGSK